MRYVSWIIRFLFFVLVLSFAVRNTDAVTVRYYLGYEWQAPLIFVLLVSFCAGVAAGILANLGQVFRQRREIAALRRERRGSGTDRGDAQAQKRLQDGFQA